MASFLHQLKVLSWKNWLSVYRQPVWSIVLIIWPVVIFFIMAMTRTKFAATPAPDCYLAPRNLQSTGMIPFLQNFLCDTDTKCSNKSYVPNTVTARSRLKKRFADSGGGDSAFQMSSTDLLATSWDRTVVDNWTAAVEIINTGKSVMQDISSGDLKRAICSTVYLYPSTQQITLQKFCQSSETLANLAIEALFSQASKFSSTQILSLINEISTKVQVLQSNTKLWNFLLMLPEYIKNPQSFANSEELVLNFSKVPQELSYIQPCAKSMLKIISQVIMPSKLNVSNILQTLSNQTLVTEMESCISLFRLLPCGSSYNCSAVEQTQTFQAIYWLVTSLTKENSSNACKFDFASLDCNNSINWDFFIQSSLTLLKEVTDNSSTTLTRYVQKIWTLLKQNGVNQIIIEKLKQEINNIYPLDPQLQSILTEMVYLLLNTTDVLITESSTDKFYQDLQTILIKLETLVSPELYSDNIRNSTGLINNIKESIINEVQYWSNLSGLFSSSNVSLQTLVEFQTIVKTLSSTSTNVVNDFRKLLQIPYIYNQTMFQEFTQSLQNLPNLNLVTSNITATLTHAIILFSDIMSNFNTNNSFALADYYLKPILQLLNSDTALQNSLGLLNPYFNYSQDGNFSRYTAILSFFTPYNLQSVGFNPNNASLELLSLISSFISTEDKQLFNKVGNVLKILLDSISTCQAELTNCSSSISRFQQQLYEIIQFISSATSGNLQQSHQLNQFNEVEINIINNMFSMILCSQAHINNDSCNNVQDIYGEMRHFLNMTLRTDLDFLSIDSVLQQFKQNVDNILHVLDSIDLPKLISHLDYVIGLSKCYTNASFDPLKCTLDLSLSLLDLLHLLPFPHSINDTLVTASSIIENWLSEVNRTVDIYQQLIYMYDLTSLAYQNQSVLQKIETTLLQIIQTLEELNINSTSQSTALLIGDLLENLNFTNVNTTFSTSVISQTKQELENINIKLQTIQWFILYVKNETETLHTPSNIVSFLTLIEIMIQNTLSVMKSNPSLLPITNEVQPVINWLETFHIVPALQSMVNMTLQDGGHITETFINNIALVFQQIIQQEFVIESPWSSFFYQIIGSKAKFVLMLLQEFDREILNNLSSVMSFTEKVLLAVETLSKDLPVNLTYNDNLQTINSISKQVLGIVYNAENTLNQSGLYVIYNILLNSWNGSIFSEFPLLKIKLMDLFYSSMQCLTDSTMLSLTQNCSSTDIINRLQLILNDFGCQISLESPTNVTLCNIFDYTLNTKWEEHVNGCAIENSNIKEELACLVEKLASTIQLISTTNKLSGINSPWVQEIDGVIAIVASRLLTNNITCAAKDSQLVHIIFQAVDNQSSHLQSLISAFMNQTELYSQNPSKYSEYLRQVFHILQLYYSMHESLLLNETIVDFWYNTMLQLLEFTQNSTVPPRWILVSSMLNTVNNISSYLKATDYPTEFIHLLNIVNSVLNLTDATVTLNASLPLVNIFDRNFSMINDLLKQLLPDMNITSFDSCRSSLQNLFNLYHNNLNLSVNDEFYSNFSLWTCSLILDNNSVFNWLKEMETIASMMITSQSGLPVGSAMKVITFFTKFLNDTNMNTFDAFVASIAEFLQQREPTMNLNAYQSIQELHSSLQAIIKEAIFNRSVSKDEKITVDVIGALNSLLRSLNITGYEEILTFATDILKIYFNNWNSTFPLENLIQRVLGGFLTSFQQSGLEKVAIQALEMQIFPQSSEEQKLLQHFINTVMSALNETASINFLQPILSYDTLFKLLMQMFTENQSNTTGLSQLENWINATHIFSESNSVQGLNPFNISEFATVWEVMKSLMDGNFNTSQVEEILSNVQNALSSQNITVGSDIFYLYKLLSGIFNQTISTGSMNLTQILQTFLTMDCEGISNVIDSIYKMIQMTSTSTTWPVDTFFANLTMDICHLLQGNYSLHYWINILHTFREFVAYVTPIVPDSVRKYFTAAEYIIKVTTDLISDPTISQSKITSIMSIVPVINELFDSTSSSPSWAQNTILYKMVYFLVDLYWTSSSDKGLLLFKTQNFFLEIIQDIQNMLKLQSDSPYEVWISFALDVVGISINTTQNTSLHERFLNKVWNSFKQNDLENITISTIKHLWLISDSAGSENAYILECFLQLVFNVTDMIISETQSNVTTDILGKVMDMALNDLFKVLLAQNKNISLFLGESIMSVNMTKILGELEMLINSLTTVNLPLSISNESSILFNLLQNQSDFMNNISNIMQILTTSDNMKYINMVMDALRMFQEFVHMSNRTDVQEFSSIVIKYLPIYFDTSNQTQASLLPILSLWQYFINETNTKISDASKAIVEILPLFKSHFLLNESIDVRNLSSWLVGIISQLTPTNEQSRLENAANASLLLIQSIQECSITPITCIGFTEATEKFITDLIQLELTTENATLVNSSLLQSGSYNQSQITIINEIFLVLSYALGYPYNSTNETALFKEFSALTNFLLNTTMENDLNITSLSSLKNIVDILKTVNMTQVFLQTENILHAYKCTNQTDTDLLLCKLNVTFKLTQLLKLLPLAQSTHENIAIISSIAEQWLLQLNVNTSVYQQFIDLYNATVLTFQYHPTLQAIHTSLVNIVHILQDMGLLVNESLHGSDITVNLSEIMKVELIIVNSISNLSQFNISELLQIIQLELDTVNWFLLQADNQTGTLANFPGAYTMCRVTQWITQNYQQLIPIVQDMKDIISFINVMSPNQAIDALNTIVVDLQTNFLPQIKDVQLTETLQTVLNVTRILLEVTSEDIFNRLEILINSLRTSVFQFNLSNDPSKIFNVLSGLNQTDFILKIAQVIQGVIGKDVRYGKMFMNALKMFNDLIQLNKTNNIQDLSVIFTKYLAIFSDFNNQTQENLSGIFNLWQYLIRLTDKQFSLNQTVVDILPFFQSHMLLNESADVSFLATNIVNLISLYIPPMEKDMFEQAANASMLLIQTCSFPPMNCAGIVEGIQKFVSDVTQLELMIQNRTLVNSSTLEFGFFNQSQVTIINNIFLMLSHSSGSLYNFSKNESGIFEELLTLTKWFLNATIEDKLNTTSITSLKNIVEMLKSANITEVLLQMENLLRTYNCSNNSDVELLQCKLNMIFHFTQFLNFLPLQETTLNTIAAISSVAEQWLSQINNNISIDQQLSDLYNITILAFKYQTIMQAINTSFARIVYILLDTGVLQNTNLNESDVVMNLLSEMAKVISNLNIYTLPGLPQSNVSEILEIFRLELDTVNWLMVEAKNQTGALVTSPGAYTMKTIRKWILNHQQQISFMIRDIEYASNSFTIFSTNNSVDALKTVVEDILTAFLQQDSIVTDLLRIFNVSLFNEPIQGLIEQVGTEIQSFMNISFIRNLFMNQSIQKDAEIALLLLQEINRNNISFILTSINQVLQTIRGIQGLDMASEFYSSASIEKIFIIVKAGMEILNDIAAKGTLGKEAIYEIYNFTYLLVQGEWNWIPFQNISAMEAELLDVFYMALKPFLLSNWTQVHSGNCSAQDILQILVQTIFTNATINMTLEETICDWQLIYSSSEISLFSNHTLGDMIYLAMQSSPVLHNVCSKDSLHPLAEEITCLMQILGLSMSILAELNKISGLQIPLIRSMNDSLNFICNNMTAQYSTFQQETQFLNTLNVIFINQSSPVHVFIKFIIDHYSTSVQMPDLQQAWTKVSKIINILAPVNSPLDAYFNQLISATMNMTVQPSWLESWQVLNKLVSMNWTTVNIEVSLSILDQLRRAVILIDNGMDIKTFHIYQALVSLFKNPSFTSLFDMTDSQLMNATASSTSECPSALSAMITFFHSTLVTFDPTHSYVDEGLLSNVSLLACDSLHIQPDNISTWISLLETFKNILPYLATNTSTDIVNYITGLEKIIRFVFEAINSQNFSQEIILGGVYEVFIQELKIFSNNSIPAVWMEKIPINQIITSFKNNIILGQKNATERYLLYSLPRILNATSYLEGFSMLSNLIAYLPSNMTSQQTATTLTQQILNLMTRFTVSVQVLPLTEPYGTTMNCLRNVTQDLSSNLSGHLEEAIQLAQDLFTQSNESANASAIPDLLKQKMYQLQNLSSIICGLEGSNNSLSYCYMPCQYLTLLQDVGNLLSTGAKVTQTAINSPAIIQSFLSSMWQAFENEISVMLSTLLPVNDLTNITTALSQYVNVTSTDFQAILANVFQNRSHVEEELSKFVNLNQTSITALMNVLIPDNKTQIGTWFTTLYKCSINTSLVAKPFQVFCNLSPEQGYQMAIIFLENVDLLKLLYRLAIPSTWQASFDLILTALKTLIDKVDSFLKDMPSEEDIINILSLMRNFTGLSTTRRKRSIDPFDFPGAPRASMPTFTTFSKIVCTGNLTLLSQALYSLYPLTRSAANRNSERVENVSQLYGIPSDNAFCSSLFTNLVQTTTGASYWSLLKPLLYGQILYSPNTAITQKIMEKTRSKILQMEDYKNTVQNISDSIQKIQANWPFMQLAQKLFGTIQTLLNNTAVGVILQDFLNLNVTDLSDKLNKADSFIELIGNNINIIRVFQNICDVLLNLMSCMSYNRIQPINSTEAMTAQAYLLQNTNDFFAAVTFNLPSESNRQKRDLSNLPKKISYSITMRSLLSEDTSSIRSSVWTPGPHNSLNMYSRGFVYLQENIDRAIIELHTNKSLDNIGVQFQPMPYPCYIRDSFLYSMSFSLPIALMISWVLFIAAFVKKLVHEKELRLNEYMKMMGVNSCSHFFAWFIESASFLVLSVSILVLILKFGNILTNSNGFILFLFFLDYSLTVIAMSFLISVFFHNTNVAGLSGSLIYIITFFPYIVVVSKESNLSFAGKTLLSLFSPTALSYGTQYIVRFEEQEEGIQWHNMYTSPVASDTFNFGWLCWVMLIDAMIYFVIGWYIKLVFPGQYGIGVVWYFPVLPSFWMECCGLHSLCSRKSSGLLMSNIVAHGVPEKKGDELYPYNEKDPTDLNLGVSLHGVTKVYQSKVAVRNLNLNFYEGHITSLLGHNGAGKTTTLSMLTGLFSASSGTIYVYGEDIRTHTDKVRKNLGVCMQYDVLFDHLTTKEHLLLYGSIKAPKWNKIQLHEEVKRTLKDTGLYSHRHKPVRTLSGGMRRKLSISIALIGGSKVVVLDEPTTGVDPCSRRGIWEVISRNKKDKTIILSTHHLDEAEVLSDRIAFLEQGGLRCCGTPLFLKEKFGSGYHLTITKKFTNQKDNRFCDSERVTSLIQSHIPEATLKEDVGGELFYVLPPFTAEISSAYLSLLRDLDANMNDLCLGCYGISDTTIEEVFLKLTDGLDEDDQNFAQRAVPIPNNDGLVMEDDSSTNSYSFFDKDDQPLTKKERVKGVKLFFKRIGAIFIKRFHNSKRNWKGLISQLLLPVLFVIAAMGLGSLSSTSVEYPKLLLTPEMYGSTNQAVVFGINNESTESLMNAMSSFPGIDNFCLDNNAECLSENSLGSWNYTGDQMLTYDKCSCSAGITACGSPTITPPHRMTFSKQMIYNISGKNMENYLLATTLQYIQKRYGGWSFGLPTSLINNLFLPLTENLTLSKVWYNNEGRHSLPAYLNSFNNFLLRANLPRDEAAQYDISVYNQPLPGTVTQSTATIILVNTLVALSVLVGYSITTASFVTYVVKEYHNGSKRLQHIAGVGEVLYWITNFLYDLTIYFIPVGLSIAMIAAFKLPAFYNYPNLGAVSLLFILFGYATFAWMYLIAGAFKNPGMAFITYVCINLFIGINTIISSSVVYMLLQQKSPTDKDYQSLNDTYNIIINIFKIFPQFCFGYGLIELSQQQAIQDQYAIYGNYEKVDIFSVDILGYMFVAMAVQGTFCFLLRLLINDGIIYSVKTFFKKLFKLYPFKVKDPDEDEDVKAERDRVESASAKEDLLVLEGLTKVFHLVNKKVFAVNNMSLAIPPGECFGLLGVNGAGKTTTFKMLTGDISPSSGNIQVRNHMGSLENVLGINTDWSSFGYCPQEDALDELMTGVEHLYYYARIHGIPERRIKSATNQLLQKLQLVQYKDRITGNYSCGTRRKLSTALALIGRPSILLLDEPSSGMDPKTKRHLWKIISEEIREKCAVVLTSHSMEECEALCTRLAIMVKGKFQCIGSLQHIKSRFGSGFTVKMHLKDSSVNFETINNFMHFHFPNTNLKEQHVTMVEYHVPVSIGGVASIFDLLESNKTALNITHFSVSQTTLDEVFINFAQAQTSTDDSSLSSSSSQDLQVVIA
ncbi:LOW QUALITY PROTEIN: glucosylceramide transporter ABCA12 [Mantella aurantiaca]